MKPIVKEAVSKSRLRVAQTRSGRRPMSVSTYLRKEKDGSLYKAAEEQSGIPGLDAAKEYLAKAKGKIEGSMGLRLNALGRNKLPVALANKASDGADVLKEVLLSKQRIGEDVASHIVQEHVARKKEAAAIGKHEDAVPWYTTAGAATLGNAVGGKVLKRSPLVGSLVGTLAGTGVGLKAGKALGKKMDERAKLAAKKDPPKPGSFLYAGGTVLEVGNDGKKHPRDDIGPDYKGTFKNKFYKKANSGGAMHQLQPGSSRGIEMTNEAAEPVGKKASGKYRPGDVPSDDATPSKAAPSSLNEQTSRSLDIAMKVAAMGHLVPRGEAFPTGSDSPARDPLEAHNRVRESTQWAGASNPVPGYMPNVDDPKASAKTAEPYTLTGAEWEKVAAAYFEELDALQADKLASGDFEELYKEALFNALTKVLPKSKRVLSIGGETVDLRNKILPSYAGVGKKLESYGNMFRVPKGVTPEMARAAGNTRAGSASGRIFGEGLHSAGHHMGHTNTVGKVMNPLGKPLGGFIEGITAQGGRELQRAGGAVASGIKGTANTFGGGARGALGRGMERHAPKVGLGGEILTAAGTATGIGHAVSPAAHGLAALAKSTGTYAPLKGALGSMGFNVAKDVAATGAEAGLHHGSQLAAKGFQAAGRLAPNMTRVGRGMAGAAM